MAPKILVHIKGDPALYARYAEGCRMIGFEPVVTADLSCMEEYDGLLLTGGADVDPAFYGEKNTASQNVDPDYDRAGFRAADHFFKVGKPILGICRGHQVLNVFFGGSLFQDIPGHAVYTDMPHRVRRRTNGTLLDGFLPVEFYTNTRHHQAVRIPGEGLRVTARALDGTVEAIEHLNGKVLGVQWHPERMLGNLNSNTEGLKVFEAWRALF